MHGSHRNPMYYVDYVYCFFFNSISLWAYGLSMNFQFWSLSYNGPFNSLRWIKRTGKRVRKTKTTKKRSRRNKDVTVLYCFSLSLSLTRPFRASALSFLIRSFICSFARSSFFFILIMYQNLIQFIEVEILLCCIVPKNYATYCCGRTVLISWWKSIYKRFFARWYLPMCIDDGHKKETAMSQRLRISSRFQAVLMRSVSLFASLFVWHSHFIRNKIYYFWQKYSWRIHAQNLKSKSRLVIKFSVNTASTEIQSFRIVNLVSREFVFC